MTFVAKIAILIWIILFSSASVLAGELPFELFVLIGDEDHSGVFESSAGVGDMFCTWDINDHEGTFQFSGSYAEGFDSPPLFDLNWRNPGDGFPLNVSIASSGSGHYGIAPYFVVNQGEDPDLSLTQYDLTGDSTFGQYFTEAYDVHFQVFLSEPQVNFDLTVTMEWGAGVADQAQSWGMIKSIFR